MDECSPCLRVVPPLAPVVRHGVREDAAVIVECAARYRLVALRHLLQALLAVLAGGSLTTTTVPTLKRRKTMIGQFARARVNAQTKASGSVGHHEVSLCVCMSIHRKDVMLRSQVEYPKPYTLHPKPLPCPRS